MKKWTYDGDIDCRHGGRWFLTKELADMDDLVETITVTPLDDNSEVYLVEAGATFVSHKQEDWMKVDDFIDWHEAMAYYAGEGMPIDFWLIVVRGFADYHCVEVDSSIVVSIGKDAPRKAGGRMVDVRLPSHAKLENYVYKHFLRGA